MSLTIKGCVKQNEENPLSVLALAVLGRLRLLEYAITFFVGSLGFFDDT